MTSKKQSAAEQKAFERGQQDFREGKSVNPYPADAPYHALWEQGYESECDIHEK